MSLQREPADPRPQAHAPELPRVYLDTRMPPAPAPGGRVIHVAAPPARARRADVTLGATILGAAVAVILLFRRARYGRPD